MTYAAPFVANLGAANTGLTLTATIIDTAGVTVLAGLTGAVEIGTTGIYRWYYASFSDGFVGYVSFLSGATVKTVVPISPAEATVVIASFDAAAVAAALGGAPVTLVSPVALSGDVSIIRGDDYANADGRALEWTNAAGTWPDLTGATITFTARLWNSTLTKTGAVIVPTGPGQKVRVEFTKVETAVALGTYQHDVQATLLTVPTRVVTLVQGQSVVTGDTTLT